MKTTTALLVIFCVFSAVAQQEKLADEKAFQAAIKLWDDQSPYEALDAFKAFMKEYPNSPAKPSAHFNVGYINFELGDYKAAASVFYEILGTDYNEQDPNSLMEPYKLYKHNSARYLAEISLRVKEWKDAQRYIHMFDKEYPYQHFCGNEWAAYDIMKAEMQARLHEGQGKIDQAVKDLVPHVFFNGLAWNESAIDLLKEILRRNYSQQEIATELESALASIKVVKEKKREKGIITLFGVEVEIENYSFEGQSLSFEAGIRKIVRENPLFLEFHK